MSSPSVQVSTNSPNIYQQDNLGPFKRAFLLVRVNELVTVILSPTYKLLNMKKILLLLTFLFSLSIYSQITAEACDQDGIIDGMTTIDLSLHNAELIVLSGQPLTSLVTYYATQADAANTANPLPNPTSYFTGSGYVFATVSGSSTIYVVTVMVNTVPIADTLPDVSTCDAYTLPLLTVGSYFSGPGGTGTPIPYSTVITTSMTIYVYAQAGNCSSESSFNVTIAPSPTPQLQDGVICSDYATGNLISGYTLNTGFDTTEYAFQWSLNGVVLAGANESSYYVTTPGTYDVVVTSFSTGCSGSATAYVGQSGPPVIENLNIVDQNVTFSVAGFGTYWYSVDGGVLLPLTFNPVYYYDFPLGSHVIVVMDPEGCGSVTLNVDVTTPNPPLGPENQTFSQGQTVADLVAVGENVLWYANQASTGRMIDMPLPPSTLLVDGTTYYASQTINGVESTQRLPVTVTLSLGINSNTFQGLVYHPNPVSNVLNITNDQPIDQVKVFNLLGQKVFEETAINISQIDFSSASSGVYFVKIASASATKILRIIKE
jgi:hypothetical protein